MAYRITRRTLLAGCTAGLGSLALHHAAAQSSATEGSSTTEGKLPWRLCLNTGTMRGFKLPLTELIQIAAQAGFSGIEPWIEEIERHVEKGGTTAELARQAADAGLVVESAIGFPNWCVDDAAERAKGMEQLKRQMGLVAGMGGKRIAAPPAGAYAVQGMDLRVIGARYRDVLEMGRTVGVLPQLEIWGSSKTLSTLGEALFVAAAADHPDATLLLDVFHLYKGGSGFDGLKLVSGDAMQVFHVNDYPADPPREKATDANRVFPGDGVAPLKAILGRLKANGFRGALSLELFNADYWKLEPAAVAQQGYEKLKAIAIGSA